MASGQAPGPCSREPRYPEACWLLLLMIIWLLLCARHSVSPDIHCALRAGVLGCEVISPRDVECHLFRIRSDPKAIAFSVSQEGEG